MLRDLLTQPQTLLLSVLHHVAEGLIGGSLSEGSAAFFEDNPGGSL